jgi:hypothetical protein
VLNGVVGGAGSSTAASSPKNSPEPEAAFLARARRNRRLSALAIVDDGSHLPRIDGPIGPIITAEVTLTCADAARHTAFSRLPTTLLDPAATPPGS